MVACSVVPSQLGMLSVRSPPPPREFSWYFTMALGGELAGMYTCAPWMKGSAPVTGSGFRVVSSLPSQLNAKYAFTSFDTGHSAGVQMFKPSISSSSFCPGSLPQYSLYLIITAPELLGCFPV